MGKVQKTYIWRMTHYTNIGFILQNGIHSCNEFLVYQHLPVNALMGIVCHNNEIANFVRNQVRQANLQLQVVVKPEYYYP